MEIKFIGYTGKYPNLCTGRLTLEIDGERKTFGYQKECDYPRFWRSGGGVYRREDDYYTELGEWAICQEDLPEFLQPYVDEILNIFETSIPHGCCGGCI